MTVSEIAQELDLTRAAVRRFLLTLDELGYVYGKNNRFELTPRVLELGYAYLSALSFPDIALPRLEQLVAETGEASEGSVLDGGDIVYVVRVPGPALMTISVNIGARRPAYATAMGRVLLANLPPADLDAYFEAHELVPVRPRTIVDVDALCAESPPGPRGRLRARGSGTRGGASRDRGPGTRPQRPGARRDQPLHAHRPQVGEGDRSLVPAVRAAAADIEVGLRNLLSWPS